MNVAGGNCYQAPKCERQNLLWALSIAYAPLELMKSEKTKMPFVGEIKKKNWKIEIGLFVWGGFGLKLGFGRIALGFGMEIELQLPQLIGLK